MECTDVQSTEALSIFYTRAVKICLSNCSLTEQAHIILYDALKTFDTSQKSTILNEAIHLINVLFNKVDVVKPQMVNRSLFLVDIMQKLYWLITMTATIVLHHRANYHHSVVFELWKPSIFNERALSVSQKILIKINSYHN